jgi:multidrug efflux pump subunit AcrA (membrane-fusion protein)
MKRALFVLTVLLIGGLLAGCGRRTEDEPTIIAAPQAAPEEEEPRYVAERGTVVKRIQFLSSVRPIEEHNLFFRADGRVRFIYHEEDEWVKANTVLAELEMTDLLNRIEQAKVTLEKMRMRQADMEENTVAVAKARAALAVKELELQKLAAEDPEVDIVVARANRDKAALALEEARAADRAYGQDGKSLEVREAELNHEIAGAGYRRALEALETHGYRLKILEQEISLARLELNELQNFVDPQIVTDARLAELELKQLEDQAAMYRLVAPIDGQVMSVNMVLGSEIKAYRPVMIVADPSSFEISADLLRDESMQLHVGQEAQIELVDQPGQTLTGTVRRLPYFGLEGTDFLDSMDRSTRIRFDAPPSMNLEVGDLARATVVLEVAEDVVFLPPEGIRLFQGRRFVVVDEGDRRRRVDVKIGLQGEDRVEIEEGLEPGQVVIGQ